MSPASVAVLANSQPTMDIDMVISGVMVLVGLVLVAKHPIIGVPMIAFGAGTAMKHIQDKNTLIS